MRFLSQPKQPEYHKTLYLWNLFLENAVNERFGGQQDIFLLKHYKLIKAKIIMKEATIVVKIGTNKADTDVQSSLRFHQLF